MGYTLKIGELTSEIVKEGLESYINNNVVCVSNDKAPAFDEPTDYMNERWPSYTSWHSAMYFVGLEDFMYNKESGLLRRHPGCFPLVVEHKEIIDKAYQEFYKKYPNCKAGYSPKELADFTVEDKDWPEENNWACRLEWLKYWVDWALENCKNPVFYNS